MSIYQVKTTSPKDGLFSHKLCKERKDLYKCFPNANFYIAAGYKICGKLIQWQKENLNNIQPSVNIPYVFFFLLDLLEQLQGLLGPGVEEGLCEKSDSALRRIGKSSS